MTWRKVICLYLFVLQFNLSIQRFTSHQELIPCDNDEDCKDLPEATCKNSECKCNNTNCEEKISIVVNQLGEPCKASKDCNIENSECKKNICTCKNGYISSIKDRKCLRIVSIDGVCEESLQCYTKTPLTVCQENKCACQQQMHENNGSCYINADLHENCVNNQECSLIEFSKCYNNKCECNEHYVAGNSRCFTKANLNSSCNEHIQCITTLGKGSYCSSGVCKCKDLYQYREHINKCVRDLLLGDICQNHTECHQPGAEFSRLECILGQCKCKSFYYEEDGYCTNLSNNFRVNDGILIGCLLIMFLNIY